MTPMGDSAADPADNIRDEDESTEEGIFLRAMRFAPGEEREAYLTLACQGDDRLRVRVESLLQASDHLGTFMEGEGDAASTSTPGDSLAASLHDSIRGATRSEALGAEEKLIGTHVDHYKLIEKLGEGGSAVVYGARQDEPIRRDVALKVIKLGMDTKSVMARFDAERQALARMEHPHIAKVLDAGSTVTGRPYFVMEWVRGVRITDFCRLHRLSLSQRLKLFIEVCHAVQHAHQKGIIHRDLKPSNVLVVPPEGNSLGIPKIIDFGIAKATQGKLTDQTLHTAFEQFLGTPAYMSPEQTRRLGEDVDTRSDVYSLGVLLYELLTGRTPFNTHELTQAGLDEMSRVICERIPIRPSVRLRMGVVKGKVNTKDTADPQCIEFLPQVRGDLDWIVMKCLEKERARRYATVGALAEDLERFLNHEPVMARPPSRWYELQKTVRRHRVAFSSAVLAVLALVAGFAVSLWQAARVREAEHHQRITAEDRQRRAYVSDMNLAQQALQSGDLGRMRHLLELYVPNPGDRDLRNWEWRYLAEACRGQERVSLVGHDYVVNNVRFIDTNTIVTTGMRDFRTILWDLSQARASKILTNVNRGGGLGLIGLRSKERQLYTRVAWHDSNRVRRLDLTDGTDTHIASFPEAVTALAVSSDEQVLAIAHGSEVEFLSTSTSSNLIGKWRLEASVRAVCFSPDNQHMAAVDVRGRLFLRDLGTQTERRIAELYPDPADGPVASHWVDDFWWCVFSPDGQTIAFAGCDNRVEVVRVADRTSIHAFQDLPMSIKGCFTPDGRWLVTVGGDTSIRVWDTQTWKQKFRLLGHTDTISCIDISPDGRWIVTGSRNGEVKVWSMHSLVADINSIETPYALSAGVSMDASTFWRVESSVSRNATARKKTPLEIVHYGFSDSMRMELPIHVDDLELDETNPGILVSSSKGILIMAADERIHFRQPGVTGDVAISEKLESLSRIQMTPDASYAVTVCFMVGPSSEWPIQVWSLPKIEKVAERRDLQNVHRIQVSEDGRWLALMTGPGEIGILKLPSLEGGPLWKAVGKVASWTAVTFSPDARYLATALGSGEAMIWDLESHKALPLARSLGEYRSLSYTADGTRLAASDGQSISLFDTRTGEKVLSLPLGGSQIAFTRPESKWLMSVQADQVRRLIAPAWTERSWDWLNTEWSKETASKRH